jgi:plasmid stabilization system protein ParE
VPRLIWTPSALADVQRLYRFLTVKDKAAASRAIRTIRTGVKILAYQPNAGRPVEDMEQEFREWLIDFGNSGYIVLYRFEGQTITILAVRHQREHAY